MTHKHGERATYPPLDVPKPVADGLWIVDSGPIGWAGLRLPIRMTVVQLSNGELWLHSPTRCDAGLRAALDRLGPVSHLVAPNSAHWTFLQDWQRHYPEACTWAAPRLRERAQVRRSGIRLDRDLGEAAPEPWSTEFDQAVVPGGGGFREIAFFHRGSRTLILTDLIVNLEGSTVPLATRLFARATGTLAPDGKAPIYLRLVVRRRRQEAEAAGRRIIGWEPERVIFSHGKWFDRDGANALRHSLRWLVRA